GAEVMLPRRFIDLILFNGSQPSSQHCSITQSWRSPVEEKRRVKCLSPNPLGPIRIASYSGLVLKKRGTWPKHSSRKLVHVGACCADYGWLNRPSRLSVAMSL